MAVMTAVNNGGVETFAADGTWSESIPVNSTERASFPASCFASSKNPASDCDGLSAFGAPEPCSLAQSGECDCASTTTTAFTYQGHYSISGTKLTLTVNGVTDPPEDYCVQNGKLTLGYSGGESFASTTFVKQ
jgi:hypothetical protein